MENIFDAVKEEVKEQVEEAKEEVKEITKPEPTVPNPKIDDDMVLKERVKDMLGVEQASKYSRDLELIVEYGKAMGYNSNEDLIANIRELVNRVGSGSDKVKTASRYAYLYLEQQSINKEMERLKNG